MSKVSPPDKGRKQRIDQLLVQRGLAETREKARALIEGGAVEVKGLVEVRPGSRVSENAGVRVLSGKAGSLLKYVGRGGLKLEGALAETGLDVAGMTVADFGASTGGFTDCLLQKGARRVYAVDVGYGQLAWSLRKDPRVHAIDRVNIRYMDAGVIPEPLDLVTIDVSFISVTKVLAKAFEILGPAGKVLALVKPQFEVGRKDVGKGGIVREASKQLAAVDGVVKFAAGLNWKLEKTVPSPVAGQKGNQEYFILLSGPGSRQSTKRS